MVAVGMLNVKSVRSIKIAILVGLYQPFYHSLPDDYWNVRNIKIAVHIGQNIISRN